MSRTNRDHAKKNQRPVIEDAVIAEQLETLLIPALLIWDMNCFPYNF